MSKRSKQLTNEAVREKIHKKATRAAMQWMTSSF